MSNVELEARLRSAASTYERLAPSAPHLEQHIFERIAVTHREHGPQPGRVGHRSWAIQLLAAAALVAFALAVAFVVREARLFGEPQPVTTPAPYQIPSPPAVGAGCSPVAREWATLPPRPARMLSATTGWAYGPMRTTDGGAHWLDVSPPSIPARSNQNDEFFLDATDAWVAETASSSKACIDHVITFRTADGGQTWQQAAPIPVRFAVSTDVIWTGVVNHASWLDFIDAQHGWLLLGSGPVDPYALGVDGPWVGAHWRVGDLFRTSDGGLHWTLVANNPGSGPDCIPAPLTGLHESVMSFSSPTTGWMIATCGLLVTHDGGVTWGKAVTPLRPNEAPVFYDVSDGLVGADGGLLVTSDGGMNWSVRPLPAAGAAVDFVNARDGMAVASGDTNVQCPQSNMTDCARNFRLYRTSDGGKTWVPGSSTSLALPAQKYWPPSYLHFVDSKNGFVDPGDTALFRTTDSGRTWTEIVGTVQGP